MYNLDYSHSHKMGYFKGLEESASLTSVVLGSSLISLFEAKIIIEENSIFQSWTKEVGRRELRGEERDGISSAVSVGQDSFRCFNSAIRIRLYFAVDRPAALPFPQHVDLVHCSRRDTNYRQCLSKISCPKKRGIFTK